MELLLPSHGTAKGTLPTPPLDQEPLLFSTLLSTVGLETSWLWEKEEKCCKSIKKLILKCALVALPDWSDGSKQGMIFPSKKKWLWHQGMVWTLFLLGTLHSPTQPHLSHQPAQNPAAFWTGMTCPRFKSAQGCRFLIPEPHGANPDPGAALPLPVPAFRMPQDFSTATLHSSRPSSLGNTRKE